MDNLFQLFLNHLIQIGFATANTLSLFIESYSQNQNSQSGQLVASPSANKSNLTEIYFRERITKSLSCFLNSINANQRQELALNMYTQFIKKNQQHKRNCYRRLLSIYALSQNRKAVVNKAKNFKQWKKILSRSSYSTCLNLNLSYQSEKTHRYNRNCSPLETSRYLREQEELIHCTFHPSLNQTRHYRGKPQFTKGNLSLSVHDRLYTDHIKLCAKKEMMRLESDTKMARTSPFQPSFVSISPTPNLGSTALSNTNFKARMKSFVQKKMDNKNKLIETMEQNFSNTCSFSPNIVLSQNAIPLSRSSSYVQVPAYQRLYIQNENNSKNQRDTNKSKDLKPSSASVNSVCNKGNVVDYKKIAELYNDYKRLQIKTELRQSKLDKERGITFAPKILLNEKYSGKLNGDFFERQKKHVEEKKKFVNIFNEIIEEHTRGDKWGNRKYTEKEKEEIAKRVVNRLYFKKRDNAGMKNRVYGDGNVDDSDNYSEDQNCYYNEVEEDILNEKSRSRMSNCQRLTK